MKFAVGVYDRASTNILVHFSEEFFRVHGARVHVEHILKIGNNGLVILLSALKTSILTYPEQDIVIFYEIAM